MTTNIADSVAAADVVRSYSLFTPTTPNVPLVSLFPAGLVTYNSGLPGLTTGIVDTAVPSESATDGRAILPTAGTNHSRFHFFGTDTNNQTFNVRIYGVEPILKLEDGASVALWKWTPLYDLACSLGSTAMSRAEAFALGMKDASNSSIGAADVYWVDEITVSATYSASPVTAVRVNGSQYPATFFMDNFGYHSLALLFDRGSSAAKMGGLARAL